MVKLNTLIFVSLTALAASCAPVHTEGQPGTVVNVYNSVGEAGGGKDCKVYQVPEGARYDCEDGRTFIVRHGSNGTNGTNGRDGKDGKPGAQGPTGPQGKPGEQGPQGERGPMGPAGRDGVSTMVYTHTSADACDGRGGLVVETWKDKNSDGTPDELMSTSEICHGRDGTDGTNGTNGTNGANGTNGRDGQDGASVSIDGPYYSSWLGGCSAGGQYFWMGSKATGWMYFQICDGAPGQNGQNGWSPEVVSYRQQYIWECEGPGVVIYVDYFDMYGNLMVFDNSYEYICDGATGPQGPAGQTTPPNLACEEKVAVLANNTGSDLEVVYGITDCNGDDVSFSGISGVLLNDGRANERVMNFATGTALGGEGISGVWFWPRSEVDFTGSGDYGNWWSRSREQRFAWCQRLDFSCDTSMHLSLPLGLSDGGGCECDHAWSSAPTAP